MKKKVAQFSGDERNISVVIWQYVIFQQFAYDEVCCNVKIFKCNIYNDLYSIYKVSEVTMWVYFCFAIVKMTTIIYSNNLLIKDLSNYYNDLNSIYRGSVQLLWLFMTKRP